MKSFNARKKVDLKLMARMTVRRVIKMSTRGLIWKVRAGKKRAPKKMPMMRIWIKSSIKMPTTKKN